MGNEASGKELKVGSKTQMHESPASTSNTGFALSGLMGRLLHPQEPDSQNCLFGFSGVAGGPSGLSIGVGAACLPRLPSPVTWLLGLGVCPALP